MKSKKAKCEVCSLPATGLLHRQGCKDTQVCERCMEKVMRNDFLKYNGPGEFTYSPIHNFLKGGAI